MKILRDKTDGGGSGSGVSAGTTVVDEIEKFAGGSSYPGSSGSSPKVEENSDGGEEAKPGQDEGSGSEEDGDTSQEPQEPKDIPNLDEFNKLLGGSKVLGAKPALDQGVKKPEAKKEKDGEKVVKLPEQSQQDQKDQPARDLTGFGPEESLWLQRMPFKAYEYFSKTIKTARTAEESYKNEKKQLEAELVKAREGKVSLPESYYDNPNAGYLMPEVQQLQQQVQLAGSIEAHWEEQLVNIRNKKEWYDLVQDPKTGAISVDPTPRDPTDKDEAGVFKQFQLAITQTGKYRGMLESTVGSFKTKHQERIANIKAVEDKVMPLFTEANKDTEEYKIYEEVAKELPKSGISKDNPAFGLLAKSCAMNMILKDYIEKSLKAAKTQQSIKKDQTKAGPTGSSFNSGGGGGKTLQTPTVADYERLGLPKIRV